MQIHSTGMVFSEARKSTWVPHLLFILSALVLVMAWVQLSDRESHARRLELEVRCGHAAARAELFVTTHLIALEALTTDWVAPSPGSAFDVLATKATNRFPGFVAIARLDAEQQVLQVQPDSERARLRIGRSAARAVETARTIIGPLESEEPKDGRFNVYVPVVRDGQVEGVVVGIIRAPAMVAAMIAEETESLHLAIRTGQSTLGTIGETPRGGAVTSVATGFVVADNRWTITASGSPEPYALGGWADEALLSGGLLLAFCFFIAIRIVAQRRDELQESEARYRTLVDHAPEAILVFDSKTRAVGDVNENAEKLFARTRVQLLGVEFDALSPETQPNGRSSRSVIDRLIHDTIEGRSTDIEWSYLVGDETLPAEMRLVKLPGDPPSIRCSMSAISERLERERAVRESEAQLRRILESTFDGVWVADIDGATSFVNHRLTQILHMKREAFDDLTLFDLVVDDDSGRRVGDRISSQSSIHHSLRRGDGSLAYVGMRSQPIEDADGQLLGTLTLVTDLSEARSLEAQLRHAQKMEAIGRLAGGVAHDFNNILMAILTACELLEPTVRSNDEAAELVQEIETSGKRAATLTRQLLTFGRKDVAQPRILEIEGLIESVERILRRVIAENIKLNIQCDEVGTVYADRVQLEQVLINLAVNASDAMPNGGTLTIRARGSSFDQSSAERPVKFATGPHTRITVTDTGEGIPAENLEKVFDPFFTTKEPGRGTGLGLATVHGTVTTLGGAITVDSLVGRGTTFSIYLPDAGDDVFQEGTPSPEGKSIPGRETILVVEDEASVRRVLERALRGAGYEVIVADGPTSALEIASNADAAIDLVVSDVIMPDMSGPALAERLVATRPHLQILYISGYAGDRLPQGLAIDDDVLLKKPFTAATLTARVRRRLDASLNP